jgi:hypothetical protein
LIPDEKQKAFKLRKKGLVELLMKTDLGQGLGKQALLNMHVKDLQEKAAALSMEIERIATTEFDLIIDSAMCKLHNQITRNGDLEAKLKDFAEQKILKHYIF